jgi:biopolymer transport protein ExbD
MRFTTPGKRRESADINVTSLVDIIFNLLIFFLLSSSFVVQSGIQIDLPQVVAPVQMELQPVVVTIKSDGTLFVNETATEWADLSGALGRALEQAAEKRVIVRGDDGASLGRAVEVMDTARELGATGLAVATRAKDPDTNP